MHLNSLEHITKAADKILRSCETRDPGKIAKQLGIEISDVPFTKQKGVYKVIKRNRYIFINQNLDEVMRSIVLLHEIGHDQLHRKKANEFQEFNLFDMTSNIMEYEANLFASHIMLPDDEVLELVYNGYDVGSIALALNSDINLVALKVSDLIRRGHPLKVPEHKSNFLK